VPSARRSSYPRAISLRPTEAAGNSTISPGDRGRVLPLALLGALIVTALATAAVLALLDVPAAWGLLGVCAAVTVPVTLWGLVSGRFLEPLPLLAAAGTLLFVARPLQLFLGWRDLYSYVFLTDPLGSLVRLDGQEMADFVSSRLREPIDSAFARASGACALFLVALLVGYQVGLGRRLAERLSRLRGPRRPVNAPAAIGLSLLVGLGASAAIIIRGKGPASAFENASQQATLSDSFALFVVAGFATSAVLIWAAWMRPRGRAQWAAFLISVVAVCAFAVAAGSRSRVFVALLALAVVIHYLWRPWRTREVVVAAVLLLAFASSFVVFREVAESRSLDEAVKTAPRHVLDGRVILNDLTSFDLVVYATTIYGRERDHEHGGFLVDGVRSFVPRAIDSGKPEGGDIVFRKAVWGGTYAAGRPPTAVGDLWIDFGFPGVAIGALLIGLLARGLLGFTAGAGPGREYRVGLYAIGLVVLLTLVVDTFSLALGYVLTLGLPFMVAVHGFGRLRT
jgi:oligosaccharide repeat unit polymerase